MIGVPPGIVPHFANGPTFMEVRQLEGHLHVPRLAKGIVVFARDPASHRGRGLERNVVRALRNKGLATCQVDLLESNESFEDEKADDAALLADRLNAVLVFLALQPQTAELQVAVIGYEKAAAAALRLAIRRPRTVHAVVSLCGQLGNVARDLGKLQAPTLLVVPGKDPSLLECNQQAFWSIRATSQLAVVRGAGRLFAESGTCVACQDLVAAWCVRHLGSDRPSIEKAELIHHYRGGFAL